MNITTVTYPSCVCGCTFEEHLFNINFHPQGEADYELGNCNGECAHFYRDEVGNPVSDCAEYRPQEEN